MPGSSLIAAAALIAVPVIIHIFNRTRYRRIDWAAMEFLLAAFRRTRRRVQMEHLLLLILRCLAMLFIALAFFPTDVENGVKAGLNWAGVSFTEGTDAGIARHMVMVLDDTGSMQYRDSNRTSFERAIERATAMVGTLREGRDRVTLIRASAVQLSPDARLSEQENLQRLNREIPVYEPGRAAEVLAQARPGFGEADMLALMREVGRRVEGMDTERERPQVVILSDFQSRAWGFANASDPQNRAWVQQMSLLSSLLSPLEEQVRLIDTGPQVAANYAITDLSLETPVIGVGIPARLRVTVGNFAAGSSQPESVRLLYRINQGEARSFPNQITVAPGEQTTVTLDIAAFDKIGPATIRVEVAGRDLMEADNARTLAVNVVDAVPVLLVNGKPTPPDGNDETRYASLALEISGPSEDGPSTVTPFRISVIGAPELEQRASQLSDYAVVLISNLTAPSERVATHLEDYVRQGGAVIFAMGDQVRPENWNNLLWRDGQGILPAPIREVSGSTRDDPEAVLFPARMVVKAPGNPLAYLSEDEGHVRFMEEPKWIFRWISLDTGAKLEGGAEVPGVRTLMAIDNDKLEPLLIERAVGRGKSAVFTTSIDGAWNYGWDEAQYQSMTLWQEMVRNSALGERGRINLNVGEHFLRILKEEEQTARGAKVVTPDGTSARPVDVALPDGRSQIVHQQTAQPGVYRLQFLGETDGREVVAREELFAVGMPAGESDISRIGGTVDLRADPGDVIRKGLPGIEIQFEAATGEMAEQDRASGTAGRIDVWLLLIGLAGMFLLMEMGLSILIGRRAE